MNASSMHVTRWGSTGPTVVMVHGSAQGSQIGGDLHFKRQADLASRGWQVVVPDRPGHGRSPYPGRPDDAVADGEQIVRDLIAPHAEGVHLVGHSFGAAVALAAAAQRPQSIRSLTLIEPAMAAVATDLPVVRRFIFNIVRILLLSFSPITRIQRFCELVNIPQEIRGGSSDEELKNMGRALKAMKLPSKKALLRELAIVKEAGIPVLVVGGGWSPAFEAISDRVAELAGGKRLVIKSPHHFPQQVSDEFNQKLVAFMTESGR